MADREQSEPPKPGWQLPGLPSMLSAADLLRIAQLQTELMTELPETIAELTRAARSLAESVDSVKDTVASAQDTVASASSVVARVEAVVNELEAPVQALRPGLRRVAEVLDAPVVQRLPEFLESVEDAVLPVTRAAERIRARLAWIREWRGRARAAATRHTWRFHPPST
jgi:uncharacterized protein Yka (UPF0111/DUF47 family)